MIKSIQEFILFFNNVRKRTMKYIENVPESILDWKPGDEKFTARELILHIGSTELMFLHVLQFEEWRYAGHEVNKGKNKEQLIDYLSQCHETFCETLVTLGDQVLKKKIPTLHGYEISGWRILLSMIEHEIHHRGQLSTYFQVNGKNPPQIFGLKIEDVKKI